MKVLSYKLHCYNHFAMDYGRQIAEIIDAAHKNDVVEINTMTEPFDIREIEWKGTKFLDILRSLCDKNKWPLQKFHIISWNPIQPDETWPSMERRWYTQVFTYTSQKKVETKKHIEKTFGIYINNSSWPRLWLSAYLNQKHNDKTDQTFVRSPANAGHMANLGLDALMFNFASEGYFDHIALDRVYNFLEKIPLTKSPINLDLEEDIHFDTRFDLKHPYSPVADDLMVRYQNIFCEIVCETMFTGECFSIDEKIARCFLTKTPFLVMGSRNYLGLLKQLGFRTFDRFWDESYDWCSDVRRCLEIKKVIDDLAKLDHKNIEKMYDAMSPILEHNRQRYLELCQDPDLEKKILDLVPSGKINHNI